MPTVMPFSLSLLILFLLLLLLLPPPGLASFKPKRLRGLYVFTFGNARCPRLVEVTATSLDISPSEITIDDESCSRGRLVTEVSPGESAGRLARYLSGVRAIGDYIVTTVVEPLVCPARVFLEGITRFTFVQPEERHVVSWAAIFENNDTWLAMRSPTGNTYAFEEDTAVMIISDRCLLRRRDIPSETGRACFPAAARAQLRSGAHVRMDHLRVGDLVRTGAHTFSPIIGFTHRAPDMAHVVRLHAANATLALTPGHYVYADGRLRRAREVRAGMRLRRAHGGEARVSEVERDRAAGMYNPHTRDGNIVVEGFTVSCYTEIVAPPVAHAWLAPVRAAAWMHFDLLSALGVF